MDGTGDRNPSRGGHRGASPRGLRRPHPRASLAGMFHVVLYQPEIPPNTGNIIRLCANTGVHLHLVHPLGFALDTARLRRAGLDYREWARVEEHTDWAHCRRTLAEQTSWYALSTRGRHAYHKARFQADDVLLFGPETRGLPQTILDAFPPERILRLPMVPASRSLNLANSCAIIVYEAWRQNGFAGGH